MKILLSAYTGLGNFVLKTPMIKALKDLCPQAQIDLIAGNSFGAEYLLQGSPLIHQTHILKLETPFWKKMQFFYQLRKEKYDVLFLPFDAHRNFLLLGASMAGIPQKIRHLEMYPQKGFRRKLQLARKLVFYSDVTFVPILAGRHEIDLNFDLLEAFAKQPITRNYQTFVHYEEKEKVRQRFNLKKQSYIIIQACAANGKYQAKVWATHHFVRLIQILLQKYPYKIVLVGDKGDDEVGIQPILQQIGNHPQLINTAAQTSINEVINLIRHARLVICHDSGIMHIADALSRPLIALYGPTDYTRTRPLKETSTILYARNNKHFAAMYAFQTHEAELAQQGIGSEAMEGITVETVLEEVMSYEL